MSAISGTPRELSAMLFSLEQDKVYEIKECVLKRSNNANKYFHKLVNELARYNRSFGHAISDEEMKKNINLAYGTIATDNGKVLGAMVPAGTDIDRFYKYAKWYKTMNGYDCYVFYKRTSELSTREFWQLLKGLESECREVGIETLEDKEFREMMERYENEINRQRDY